MSGDERRESSKRSRVALVRRWGHGGAIARGVAGFVGCLVAAGVVALPLALEQAVEHTRVHDSVGVAPATFALTGNSLSQLRLGLLGNFYVPDSKGPFGLSVTVDGPPRTATGTVDVVSYFSPQTLEIYAGLFHEPGRAIEGYVDLVEKQLVASVIETELVYAFVGGSTLFVVTALLRSARGGRPTLAPRAQAGILALALLGATGIAAVEFHAWSNRSPEPASVFALPSLAGTRADGTVTDSPVLRLAIEGALPKVDKLISRQERRTAEYVQTAIGDLHAQSHLVEGPQDGEVAIMLQSDMHCNAAMIQLQQQVTRILDDRYGPGTLSLLAITGDLTTNGTAAEGGCIQDEARISDGAPIAAIIGNHETDVSAHQMDNAGMQVLDGKTVEVGGSRVLGAGDPARTEMFGATHSRGDQTQQSVGEALFDTARETSPELLLVHEGYAAAAFIGSGVTDMTDFLDGRGSDTVPWDDGVRDLPTSAVFYGHWHRGIEPRVVWNSDGSWTLVMELNTSGGAIASPTLNHFSTPWSTPQQEAAFPVLFKNQESGLVTGYQLFTFDVHGRVTVGPRITIGSPGGHPLPVPTGAARVPGGR